MELIHIQGPSPLYTNTFLLFTKAGNAIAIDPAANARHYLEETEKRGAKLTHILLTHGHYDHVGAVRALREKTGAKVTMDVRDAQGNTLFPLLLSDIDGEFSETAPLQIDELTFRCWHTPGHSVGSWCLYCPGNLFTGDTLFAGSCGRADLAGGSAIDMSRSLSLLAELKLPDETNVLPGHEGFSTLGVEKKHNPYLSGGLF